jgi:outer membrane protein assembly factor BamD (BamD/ComL family)
MKNIIIITVALSFLFLNKSFSQNSKILFEEAYKAYQNGSYEESIVKVTEAEKLLGGINPKIQSLKVLNYYENGDSLNALREIERYLKTNPSNYSPEYSEMLNLREELNIVVQREYKENQEKIESLKQESLNQISSEYYGQKDLVAFEIAREAGTIEALELFLLTNTSSSLKYQAEELMAAARDKLNYQELIDKGMEALEKKLPKKAEEAFLSASKIHSSKWLTEQIKSTQSYAAYLSFNRALDHIHRENWKLALEDLNHSQRLEPSEEKKAKILEVEDELEYVTAVSQRNPELVKKYLKRSSQKNKEPHAISFLFNFFIEKAEESIAAENFMETEKYLEEINALKSSAHWDIFASTCYDLVLQQAKNLTSGSKAKRKVQIARAIDYYEDLDENSGERYRTKIAYLKYKEREWNRKTMWFLEFNTDQELHEVGMAFGGHKNNALGFAFHTRFAKEILMADLSGEESFEFANEKNNVQSVINILANKKIFYPLWLYGGAGLATMYKLDRSPTEPLVAIINRDSEVNTINFEGGVSIHFKPIVLSIGASYPYLNADQKLKLGMENNPLYINLGAGIGW